VPYAALRRGLGVVPADGRRYHGGLHELRSCSDY
jgi:hypothetical protein